MRLPNATKERNVLILSTIRELQDRVYEIGFTLLFIFLIAGDLTGDVETRTFTYTNRLFTPFRAFDLYVKHLSGCRRLRLHCSERVEMHSSDHYSLLVTIIMTRLFLFHYCINYEILHVAVAGNLDSKRCPRHMNIIPSNFFPTNS